MEYEMELLIIVLLTVISNSAFSKRTPTLLFTGSRARFDPAYMSAYDIEIVPSIPGSGLNVVFNISRDFDEGEEPMIQIVALKKSTNSPEFRSIFSFEMDYCRIFGGDGNFKLGFDMNVANILSAWINNVKKYGNMPPCPIVKGHYAIDNLQVNKKSIPPFLLAGTYRLQINKYIKVMAQKIFYMNGSVDMDIKKN